MEIDVFSIMYPAFQLCKRCFEIRAEIKIQNLYFNGCCGTKILKPEYTNPTHDALWMILMIGFAIICNTLVATR